MLNGFLALILSFSSIICPCTCDKNKAIHYSLNEKNQLPYFIKEASGIVTSNKEFFVLRDSGNSPYIYQLNENFQLIDSIYIPFKNTDWEDIALVGKTLFIGDFGNNLNKRKDLRILIYNISTGDTASIRYHYSDQTSFPPHKKSAQNFDCEAMILNNDSIFLFSKNKRSHKANIYILPAYKGYYTAEKVNSIRIPGRITSANKLNDTSLIILTYGKMVVLSNSLTAKNSFEKTYCKRFLQSGQSEAITVDEYGMLYIANEAGRLFIFRPRAQIK